MNICLAAMAAVPVLSGCDRDSAPPLSPAATRIGDGLIAEPLLGPGYAALEKAYPPVWRSFLVRAAEEPETDIGAQRALSALEADLAPATPGLIVATDETLGNFLRARINLLRALKAADVQSCADYVGSGQLSPTAPQPVRAAMLQQRAAFYQALASAREAPDMRKPLTAAEEVQATDIAREVERELGLPKQITAQSSAADRCLSGLGLHEILARMSPSLGGRLFADDVMDDWQDKTKFPAGV